MRVLVFLVATALLSGCGSVNQNEGFAKMEIGQSPMQGSADAWVTMVEFSDFECLHCRDAWATVKQLEQEYGNNLRVVFKNFPLTRVHQRAWTAAMAVECASQQGTDQFFWEMADKLFADEALEDADIINDANEMASNGLNVDSFKQCLIPPEGTDTTARDASNAAVKEDYDLGQKMGVPGTPSFYINGWLLVGNQPIDKFRELIDRELAKALASGVPAADYYNKVVLEKD